MSLNRRKFILDSGKLFLLTQVSGINSLLQAEVSQTQKLEKFIRKKYRGKKIALLYPEGCLDNLKPITKMLLEKTGVEVLLKETQLDAIPDLLNIKSKLRSKRQEVDLALPATFAIPDLVEAKSILNLANFSRQYESKFLDQKFLYDLGGRYHDTEFYGYQTDGDVYLMFYHSLVYGPKGLQNYANRFGKKWEVPRTWKELDTQIKFFHTQDKNIYGGNIFRTSSFMAWEFWLRLHAKGVLPIKENFTPNLSHSLSLEALKELIELTKFLEPQSKVNGLFENWNSYTKGDKFANIGWGGSQKFFKTNNPSLSAQITYGPTPGGEMNGNFFDVTYFNWGWNYVVSSTSKKQELSYLISLLFSSKIYSTLAVKQAGGYFDPYAESHYSHKDIIKLYGTDFLKVHKQSLSNCIPDFYVENNGSYFNVLKTAINACLNGHFTVSDALKNVDKEWEKITEKVGRKKQIFLWEKLKKSYPENYKKFALGK